MKYSIIRTHNVMENPQFTYLYSLSDKIVSNLTMATAAMAETCSR